MFRQGGASSFFRGEFISGLDKVLSLDGNSLGSLQLGAKLAPLIGAKPQEICFAEDGLYPSAIQQGAWAKFLKAQLSR